MKHISIFFVASYSRQHWMIHEDAFPSLQNGLSEDAGLAHSLNSDRLLQSTLCMMEPTALHCRPEIKLNTTQEKAIKNLPLQHSGYSFFLLKRVGEIEVLRTLSQEPTGYCLALQELPSLGGSAGRWHPLPRRSAHSFPVCCSPVFLPMMGTFLHPSRNLHPYLHGLRWCPTPNWPLVVFWGTWVFFIWLSRDIQELQLFQLLPFCLVDNGGLS